MQTRHNVFQGFRFRRAPLAAHAQASSENVTGLKRFKAQADAASPAAAFPEPVPARAASEPAVLGQPPLHTAPVERGASEAERGAAGGASDAAEAPPAKRTRRKGPASGGCSGAAGQPWVVQIAGIQLSKRKLTEAEILAIPGLPGLPDLLGSQPLRLLIGGNNPSEHAWRSGHYYSHPANHMWRLLISCGIAPPSVQGPADDWRMPGEAGVAFLDVGFGHPGTHLAAFSSQTFQSWVPAWHVRLAAHTERASRSIGCVCGQCGAPAVVAFSGKRQWVELLNAGRPRAQWVKTVPLGPQQQRPEGWPFPAETEVWVQSSTSGASPQTNAAREAPWLALAERLCAIPWPRDIVCLGAREPKPP